MNKLRPALCGLLLGFVCLTSCETTSIHQFAAPAASWKSKSGQLAYQSPKMSLIGEVLVRYSAAGDLDLVFSKGPGVTLFRLRQDAQFGSAEGPLARGRWSGPVANAPARLRPWFVLRDKIAAGGSSIRVREGGESFNLQF